MCVWKNKNYFNSVPLIASFIALVILGAGCAQEENPASRTFVNKIDNEASQKLTEEMPTYVHPLSEWKGSACERLSELTLTGSEEADRTVPYYRLYTHFDRKKDKSALDFENGAFLQHILSEKGVLPSDEEFKQKISEKLSELCKDWRKVIESVGLSCPDDMSAMVVLLGTLKQQKEGLDRWVWEKFKAWLTNKQIEAYFPGIYSGAPDKKLEEAKFFLWLKYSRSLDRWSSPQEEEGDDGGSRLRQKLRLFDDPSGKQFPVATLNSLRAALSGQYNSNLIIESSEPEGLCSYLIWQQVFDQLLRIKGHERPRFLDEYVEGEYSRWTKNNCGDPFGARCALANRAQQRRLAKLSPKVPRFDRVKVSGAFLNSEGVPVALSTDDLKTYNPAKTPFIFSPQSLFLDKTTSVVPLPTASQFSDVLNYIESLALMFEAMSPAGPWVEGKMNYILGDLDNLEEGSILPSEAFPLVTGLLFNIGLKNMTHFHLRLVDQEGRETQSEKDKVGITFGNPEDLSQGRTTLYLRDVLQLTRITTLVGASLEELARLGAKEALLRNPVLDQRTLVSLLGNHLSDFSSLKVDSDFTPGESALDKIQQLQWPLTTLITSLGYGPQGCHESMAWDLQTGEKNLTTPCGEEMRSTLKETTLQFALQTRSPLLYQRAR